ncbi:MAG: GTPase, partial [Mycobacterium sp.]
MTLSGRLAALASVGALGAGRLPEDVLADVRGLDERAGTRLRLSGEHTVVALAGATGSGKSSLFNVIAGAPLATVGVRRPTTSATQAAVFGPSNASELLDWLQIRNRQQGDASSPELSGLLLLDLPDHDSVELSHRAEVDRLVRLVDAFIWVLDPQKYADAVLHDAYLRPLAPHREVMVVVLNQSDRLSAAELNSCVADLDRLLAEDGLAGVPVLATSAVTPDGAAPLHEFLVSTVADHRARTARVSADLDSMAARLAPL